MLRFKRAFYFSASTEPFPRFPLIDSFPGPWYYTQPTLSKPSRLQNIDMPVIQVLVLSDTHNDAFPDPASLPRVDVVLHCGDLTMVGGKSNYLNALRSLAQIQAELKLVIAGNHDLSLDADWWQAYLQDDDNPQEPERMKQLMRSQVQNGIHYLEEGTHSFTLQNGAKFSIYASPYTPQFNGYAFAYPPDQDRFNLGASNPVPDNVDIIMSHGPPRFPANNFKAYRLDTNKAAKHCGCPHLFQAVQRVRPLLHCFGHIHEGYGAQLAVWNEEDKENGPKIEEIKTELQDEHRRILPSTTTGTLLVNAALKVHGADKNNLPWILSLPIRHST